MSAKQSKQPRNTASKFAALYFVELVIVEEVFSQILVAYALELVLASKQGAV